MKCEAAAPVLVASFPRAGTAHVKTAQFFSEMEEMMKCISDSGKFDGTQSLSSLGIKDGLKLCGIQDCESTRGKAHHQEFPF